MKKLVFGIILMSSFLASTTLNADNIKKGIDICQNPTMAQKHTIKFLSYSVGMKNLDGKCSALYKKVAQIIKLNVRDKKIEDISPLIGLIKLRTLDLGRNHKIQDYSPLKSLINLRSLDLDYNFIGDKNILVLKNLRKLEKLYLASNNLTNINLLSNLSQLTELSLSQNKIQDISPLKKLTFLKRLNLGRNNVHDITTLRALKKLTNINLYKNPLQDISPLKGLVELTNLDISSTQVDTVCPIKDLPKLKQVNIDSTRIYDKPQEYSCESFLPYEDCPDCE